MYESDFGEEVKKILKKWYKKNREYYTATLKKIDEILKNPQRYKALRHDLRGRHRVHIMRSFVLTFRIDNERKTVRFISLDHHDKVYK
jgi:YafQ family addiction module toxin component